MALVLAFASTTLISLSYLREHGAVAGLPPLSLRRPLYSVTLLLTNRAWLLGFAMESGGFGLYVAALALAPLALVQCVKAGGVGILAVASARLAHRKLTRREARGASLAVAGLAFLAVSLSGGSDSSAQGSLTEIALWLGATTGTAVLVFTSGRAFLKRGVGEGIAGGLFFAAGDICTKLATEGGARTLFVIPLIVGYLLGTSLCSRVSEWRGTHRRGDRNTANKRGPDRRRNGAAARAVADRSTRRYQGAGLRVRHSRRDSARQTRSPSASPAVDGAADARPRRSKVRTRRRGLGDARLRVDARPAQCPRSPYGPVKLPA